VSEVSEWSERATEVSERMWKLNCAFCDGNCNRTRDDQDDDVS